MRKILMAVLILGLTITAFAQTHEKVQSSTPLTISAGKWQMDGESIQLTGKVSFKLQDGTVVTADEAVINSATRQTELRGNVHMTVPCCWLLQSPPKK
jgi:lipopolysaccharide assembly outer membrane protein LptD (OstA)